MGNPYLPGIGSRRTLADSQGGKDPRFVPSLEGSLHQMTSSSDQHKHGPEPDYKEHDLREFFVAYDLTLPLNVFLIA